MTSYRLPFAHLPFAHRGVSIAALVVLPLAVFASCADSAKQVEVEPPDDSLTLDAGDGGAEAEVGCEHSEAGCALSCEDAPWCPVPVALSPFAVLTAVWGSGKNDVWAVGSNATVVHWDGSAWVTLPFEGKNSFTLNTVWSSGPNDVWTAGATDTVFHANGFAGAATRFERVTTPLDNSGPHAIVQRIWGSSAADVYLAGQRFDALVGEFDYVTGNMFKKTADVDGGVGWTPVPGRENILDVWGTAADDLWISAEDTASAKWKLGLTFHGTLGDAGALEWTNVDSRSRASLRALWGSSKNDIWAVGDVGTIRHLTSADASEWTIVESPTGERLNAVWGSAADDVWAVGAMGTILHYDGREWAETLAAFPAGKRPHLYGVWGSARDDVWIVGDGIALHYDGRAFGDAGGAK